MKVIIDTETETITLREGLEIQLAGDGVIDVNGVLINLDVLEMMSTPRPDALYRLTRDGDIVTVTCFQNKAAAKFLQDNLTPEGQPKWEPEQSAS